MSKTLLTLMTFSFLLTCLIENELTLYGEMRG